MSDERTVPAATTVALVVITTTGVLAVAAVAGPTAMAAAVLAAGVTMAWGWAGALGLPSPRGTTATLAITAVILTAVVAVASQEPLTWLPAALGGSVVIAFAHQLLRRDGRPRLTESVASVLLGMGVLTSGVLFLPLAGTQAANLVVAALAAGAIASIVETGGRWEVLRPWTVPAALIAGGGLAVLLSASSSIPWTVHAVVGVAAAGLGYAVRAVFSVLPTMAHARPAVVSALASVLISGGAVYTAAWVFTDLVI